MALRCAFFRAQLEHNGAHFLKITKRPKREQRFGVLVAFHVSARDTKPDNMHKALKMELEKSLPIPKVVHYPFAKMDVGDSLFFETMREVENAQSAAYSYAKTHGNGFKVTRRKMDNGYRIWRIA